ncbi:MAG: hypothetical protein FWF92_08905 [Oscillospiraceae bacterium]|nr:hypothetical protein [Oscillospiraceae bacterium]
MLQGQVFRVNDETDPNYKDNNKYSRISTDNRVVVTYALSDYIYEKPTDDKNDFESEMDEKEFSDETPKLTSSTEPKTFEELSEAIEAAKTVYYNATKEAEVLFYQAVNDDSFDIFSRALDDSLAKYDDEAESLFKYVDAFNEQLYEDDKIDYKSYFDFYTETYKLYSDSYTEIYKAYSDAYSASLNALFNGIVQASPVTPTNAPGGNTEAPKTSNSEWKEFLKLYEEWVDDYVKLLNKYNDNPLDMSILFDYIESIQKMAEWSEKADKIQSDLSGDDLIEYLAAMARIIQKLGQVN